ncbi:hypothetical protein BGZ46_003501 [Entomortierella lignicola]|nr:hypothetical protein BGZ46_003501 [Entomortierella lignicola]
MEDFYERLLSMSFEQSSDAIAKCRELARQHGFTVKQETSSNKNVYLYCSREGVPDSVKNNKEIKRKRLSMRCDCKWRITLFQQDSKLWVFRKAMNPASMNHNHALISPDDIRQPWPAAVFDRIAFYANQRCLSTAETRERIKDDFPDLVWDERRFYNRLTEERKQIKLRDSEIRVFSTMDLAARVASLASADPGLSYRVTTSLENVLVEICEHLRIDPAGANSRVMPSPSSSAGGGGLGASSSMNMTSPTSTSPGFSPTSSISSPNSSDYVVTYPGCIISVKSTPNQKGRPSISSPVVDTSYGLGLGMSPLNDRKRSLSEECFTRHGIGGGPSAATPSFSSAMSATQMMSHLDMTAASGNVAPLQGSISSLDPSAIPGNTGLLMMQGGGYHAHPNGNHVHQQQNHQQQQHHHQLQQQHQQQLQYTQHESQHHHHHHLPSGMATAFRQPSLSQPQSHQQQHHHQHQQHIHPLAQDDMSSSELSLDIDPSDSSPQESTPTIKRTHSVDIKQELQFYQPMLSAQQIAPTAQPQKRLGSSPGPAGPARLYPHPYQQGPVPHSGASSQQMQAQAQALTAHSGFHNGQILGNESEDVFSSAVAFTAGQYHYNDAPPTSNGSSNYLHPGYTNVNQSPTLGQHDR